jgi:hypothetical protein
MGQLAGHRKQGQTEYDGEDALDTGESQSSNPDGYQDPAEYQQDEASSERQRGGVDIPLVRLLGSSLLADHSPIRLRVGISARVGFLRQLLLRPLLSI